jgi:hypothetical protein
MGITTLGAQVDLFGGEELLMDSLLTSAQLGLRECVDAIVIDSHGYAHLDSVTRAPYRDERGCYVVELLWLNRPVRLFRVFPADKLCDSTSDLVVKNA